jgi:general secretion pathway protein C
MQDLVKRYFWAIGAIVVLVCAVFAAKATSHIIEAKALGDSNKTPRVVPAVPSPMQKPAAPVRSKDGGQFATRNMFCSECTPSVAVATNTDPSQIQTTTLPLILLATMVATEPKDSYATIVNTENQKQGAFAVGDQIPGASGKLKEIHYKYVDFENSGHTERLVLSGASAPVATAPVAEAPAPSTDENKDDMQASIDAGIKKIDDSNYEIDKSLVDKILANPMGVAKGARVVPAVKNGQPDGFKLYAIRPSSVYAKLGLANGDTLQSINGFELNSADSALNAYTKLREATSLELNVTRRGKPMTLKYQIR